MLANRDKESISNMRTIAAAARKAGMEVTELIVPGAGHDWHAVQAVWRPVSTGLANGPAWARWRNR